MRPVKQSEAAHLIKALSHHADPVRAVGEKRYLKSSFDHLGVKVPQIRAVVKKYLLDQGDLKREEVLNLVEALWRSGIHEARVAAAELLRIRVDLLLPEDFPFLEGLLSTSYTWTLVDNLSTGVCALLWEKYQEAGGVLDSWAVSGDFWVRRAALLTLLPSLRAGGGDFERFVRYASFMLSEKEFFIRKAIGWVLRDTSHKRPHLVASWVRENRDSMAGLTYREAVRRLEKELRDSYGLS